MAMLKRRVRGEPKRIDEIEKEVSMAATAQASPMWRTMPRIRLLRKHVRFVESACYAVVTIIIALLAAFLSASKV